MFIQEFLEMRKKGLYKKIIDEIGHLPSEKCSECKYLDRCYGGCPVLWNNYSFDELYRDKENL